MRAWIDNCAENHECSIKNNHFAPTRLLNVHNGVALQETEAMGPVSYVALSHCWGKDHEHAKKSMSTTNTSNIRERRLGIDMDRYDHYLPT